MSSHAGLPTHMILNPEPNLRPLTIVGTPREETGYRVANVNARNPMSVVSNPPTPALDGPTRDRPVPEFPRSTTRTTTPVPVRSKQRSHPTDDPQPKKKQRITTSTTEATPSAPPLPVISEIPRAGFNSDDSDDDAASKAPSIHENPVMDTGPTTTTTTPTIAHATPPPGNSAPIEPPTTTHTLFVSFNLLKHHGVMGRPRFVPGQTWKIKN